MDKWDEYEEWLDAEEAEPELFDEEEEEKLPPLRTYRNLAQMERDGEAATRVVEAMLAADPNTPSEVILEEMRKHVRPLSDYRPTDAELAALRRADIIHTLRGGKKRHKKEEDNNEEKN